MAVDALGHDQMKVQEGSVQQTDKASALRG